MNINLIQNQIKSYFMKNRFCLKSVLNCRQFCATNEGNSDVVVDEELIKNERIFVDLDSKQFECLAKTAEDLTQIESILSHYQYMKYSSTEVPTTLTTDQMRHLLDLKSLNLRNKFLYFLYEKEIKTTFNKKIKTIEKTLKQKQLQQKWVEIKANRTGVFDANGDIVYGLWHNTLFTRISPQYLRRYSGHRLRNACLFGQNVVFDLRVDRQMNGWYCSSKLKQLVRSYQTNRYRFGQPFHLHFSNIDYESNVWQTIEQNIEEYSKYPYFLSAFSPKSYLDLFDRKKLVYLSAKAEKPLEYDCNDVFIIGFNDDYQSKDSTFAKKRLENIFFRRLPLDEHVFWNSGHPKDLKSYQVLSILNDVKEGMGWKEAIERNVPKSYIKPEEVVANEVNNHLRRKRKQQLNVDLKHIFEQ